MVGFYITERTILCAVAMLIFSVGSEFDQLLKAKEENTENLEGISRRSYKIMENQAWY